MTIQIVVAPVGLYPMLPIEILQIILRQVGSFDWPSVKSCSLVSHTFLSLSRQILFRNVHLALEPQHQAVSGDIGHTSPPSSHISQFLQFLNRDTEVSSFVQILHIDRKTSRSSDEWRSDWKTCAEDLVRLRAKLKRLSHLSLQSSFLSDWTVKDGELRGSLIALLGVSSLQSLEISCCGLKDEEMLSLIAIPRLRLFCVEDISINLPPTSSRIESASHPPSNARLHDLVLTPRHTTDLQSVRKLLKAVEGSLRSLRYYCSPYDDCRLSMLDEIHLSSYLFLCHLTVCIPLTDNASIPKLVSIFSLISSPTAPSSGVTRKSSNLKSIDICCDVDHYNFPSDGTITEWNWAALDTLWTSTAYERLERVETTVKRVIRGSNVAKRRYNFLEEKVLKMFQKHLLTCSAKGLVVAGKSAEFAT